MVNVAVYVVGAFLVFCPAGAWKLFWVGTTIPWVCLESAQHTMAAGRGRVAQGCGLARNRAKGASLSAPSLGSTRPEYIFLSQQGLQFPWARQTRQLSCNPCVRTSAKMSLL